MRQKTVHCLILMAMMGIGLTGCHSDVNLNDITVDSKVNARLSLPIGEISTTFNDLIGLVSTGDKVQIIVNEDGLLELVMEEQHEREFHKIDVGSYIGTVEQDMFIQQVTQPALTIIPADGNEHDVPFDLNVTFSNVNDNTSDERLDSLVIDTARFVTRITTTNLGLTDDDIQKVTMILGPQFRRKAGNSVELDGFKLNKDMPIILDDFTLVMMKDETKKPGKDNVINTATIQFVLTLKPQTTTAVAENSGFHFKFEVTFMHYSALYGHFGPDKGESEENKMAVPLKLDSDEPLILPAKNPEISMQFTYGISIPFAVHFDYIKAMHPNNEETYATWNGSQSTTESLQNIVPVTASIDSTAKSSIILNSSASNGTIDKFFEKQVTDLSYKYDLQIDNARALSEGMDQFRITKNTKFNLDFKFTMPFEFKKGLDVAYSDTIKDINLEAASLDSLAAQAGDIVKSIDSANLSLYLVITNEIPVAMTLDAEFLDASNKPLDLMQLKNIQIKSAEMASLTDITPVKSIHTVAVVTEDFAKIAKTKAIKFRVHVGDNQQPSAFMANKKLSIRAGITGDVQGMLNLELTNTNNNNQQ